MTNKQKPWICPLCKSIETEVIQEIHAWIREEEDNVISSNCYWCLECDATWSAVFVFKEVRDVEKGT